MLLDDLLPEYDATRIEHRVIDAPIAAAYAATLDADFLRAARENPAVHTLFAVRGAAERMVGSMRGVSAAAPPGPDRLRLADLPEEGEWIRLGEDPPQEIAFGVIGRFWDGVTAWERIDTDGFRSFDRPGFARIACNFSLRPYGAGRTLVSYEARTRATDPRSRAAFLRYWRAVAPGVGLVMRAQLAVIDRTSTAATARFHIVPGLPRDRFLAEPESAPGGDEDAWWRLAEPLRPRTGAG